MSYLIKPAGYKALLNLSQTEMGIKKIKDFFQQNLSSELRLRRVTAPLFVLKGMGINDDLNGTERAVTFPIKDLNDSKAEIVHSLAKWKRLTLADYHIEEGYGIYTDMNAIRAGLEAMVKNIRRDSTEGLVLPFGYTFELTSTGGSRQFDTNSIIARYDTKISQTVLADFIQLGHESVGSFALSSDKTNLFSMAICAFLDIICQTFNSQGIPALIDINGDHFAGVTDYPRLTHGDIEDVDLATMATFIKDMTSIGVIIPDESLEDYVRQLGKLPKRTTDTVPMEARRAAQQQGNEPPEPETAAGKGHDGEEGFEDSGSHVSAARKRLGRE